MDLMRGHHSIGEANLHLQFTPKYRRDVFRRLKRVSSRRIRQGCWDSVKKLWGEAFWSGGYFYRSIGSTTSESIQHYIERSQSKHWTALDYEEYRYRKICRRP
jgi:hypothetical protein